MSTMMTGPHQFQPSAKLDVFDGNTHSFRIGLIFPEVGKHNLDYYVKLLDKTKEQLDLLVFPEAFETIAPSNQQLSPETISDESTVQDFVKKYAKIATQYNCGIIVGFQINYGNVLFSGGGNDQYCLFVNPQNNYYIYHKHATSKFNAFFDSNWSIENNLKIVSLKNIQIGISVCHDSYISLLSRYFKKKGANVWVNISYQNVRPRIWESIHYTRAVENNIVSLCTLHRNSNASNPQKEPYAFSPLGKIHLIDVLTKESIDEISEQQRTGRIYYFDLAQYKVAPVPKISQSNLSKKPEMLSITYDENGTYGVYPNNNRYCIVEIGIEEFCSPELLWKISLSNLNKTTIFIVRLTCNQEWEDKKSFIHKIITGRIIEFSTAFIFIEHPQKIFMAAYRSSNYKDTRVFYPQNLPITIDGRYLKGISSTCKISLNDPRNRNGTMYMKRIHHLIDTIKSF